MHCPFCDFEDTRVTDSRTADGGGSIRRRRECPSCKKRFWTFERYESARLLVIKKDGRREEFDRKKILDGVLTACQKRPVAYQDVDNMVSVLERDLRASGDVEIPSVLIGERIMERLIEIDEVAYVRFASVYKEFKDVSRFSEELRTIASKRDRLTDEVNQVSQSIVESVSAAVAAVRAKTDLVPEIAMILGSGLGSLADEVENPVAVSFGDIPGFASSTVQGHVGELVIGRLEGHVVCIMRGRVHFYEGITMNQVTFPVRVMHALGANILIVTNAAGGVAPRLSVGDLMLISDHINFMGTNPLIGPNEEEFGPRFPAMAHAYDAELREIAKKVAESQGFKVQEGVYWAMSGPSFETPAEVRMIGILGGDAVGMSTVPEVIVAAHSGMKVFGVSCITNVHHKGPANDTHADVLQAADSARPRFIGLIRGVVKAI